MPNFKKFLLTAVCLAALSPVPAFACACGCGVFDVSTGSMMPTTEGGTAWLEYDYLNQTESRSGTHSAPRADNTDKLIHTDFVTAGGQYLFNRSWGVQVQVPYWNRNFKTAQDDGSTPTLNTSGLGDIRLKALYTGLSEDLSDGLTFGIKLPTGRFREDGFDRDTQIGTGSTDLLFGAYHRGELTEDGDYNWFVHGEWDQPVAIQDDYRPGDELDVATGIYYDGFEFGEDSKVVPLLQLIGSTRMRDRGANAHPEDTGYNRLQISPGVEYDVGDIKLYGDVEVPIYQNINGNQLTAPVAFKFLVARNF